MKCLLSFAVALLCLLPVLRADGILVQNSQKIAFLGDSITANGWNLPGGYVKLVVDGLAKEGVTVTPIPAGVSGNTSKDMLGRFDKDVLSKQPDWMTLSCGVNDVWHGATGVDLETYKKNITSIVDQAQAKGIKVVILTATPILENDNPNNQKLADYNAFLHQFAAERKLPVADLNAAFQEALKGRAVSATSHFLTMDGVHPNPEGNLIMAKGVLAALGVAPDAIAKLEQAWLTQANTATVNVYPFDPRPDLAITLGQYRVLEKTAEARGADVPQLCRTLWLQALAAAVQAHGQEPLLDGDKIKGETAALLKDRIEALEKSPSS